MSREHYLQEYIQYGHLTEETARYYLRLLRRYWSADILDAYYTRNYYSVSDHLAALNNEPAQKLASSFLSLCAWMCNVKGEVCDTGAFDAFGIPYLSLQQLQLVIDTPLDSLPDLRGLTFWRFKLLTYFLCYVEPTPQALMDITISQVSILSNHVDPRISQPFTELMAYSERPLQGYAFSGQHGRLDRTSIHRIVNLASQRLFSKQLQPKAIAHTYYLVAHNNSGTIN